MHMWYRYLLHISTVVNVFSYAIVFFSAQILVDQEQRNKTKNARCTGGGGEDSLVHEVDPDKPRVGCVNPRLVTGSVPIRDELSSLVDSGSVQR